MLLRKALLKTLLHLKLPPPFLSHSGAFFLSCKHPKFIPVLGPVWGRPSPHLCMAGLSLSLALCLSVSLEQPSLITQSKNPSPQTLTYSHSESLFKTLHSTFPIWSFLQLPIHHLSSDSLPLDIKRKLLVYSCIFSPYNNAWDIGRTK